MDSRFREGRNGVGRKSRRAEDGAFQSFTSAPDLSRAVRLFLSTDMPQTGDARVQMNLDAAARTARLKTGANSIQLEIKIVGAPSFSPYRRSSSLHTPLNTTHELMPPKPKALLRT